MIKIEGLSEGTFCGVYLNGALIAAGPLVHRDRMRDRIQGELNRSQGGGAR